MAEAATEPEIPRRKEKLEELTQAASLQYSLKNWSAAAEHYANATEIQAELNGEMAPENAELLFYYGRALYKVAIQKSDVLGGKVAQEESKKPKAVKKADVGAGPSSSTNGSATTAKKEDTVESKPFFQLQGDWEDSEDEEEEDTGEGAEDEQDDFQDAYEIFEIARVLYTKQFEALDGTVTAEKGKGKAELAPEVSAIKNKIADCHGYLAEISLESERFHEAVKDARKNLEIQEELLPEDEDNVVEAHYSLSLALEFASVSKVREEQSAASNDAEPKEEEQEIDYELRKEAATHTEACIKGLEIKIQKARDELAASDITPDKKRELEYLIKDKSEVLVDMKNRVSLSMSIAI
jgi:HAT1-interacting factor 1